MYPIYVDALPKQFILDSGGYFRGSKQKISDLQRQGEAEFVEKKSAAKPHTAVEHEEAITVDRRESRNRRLGADRRSHSAAVVVERRGMERRVKVNRRRQIDPTTCERDYTSDEIEFMSAIEQYKRQSGRMFPTCSEVLGSCESSATKSVPKAKRPPCRPWICPALRSKFCGRLTRKVRARRGDKETGLHRSGLF